MVGLILPAFFVGGQLPHISQIAAPEYIGIAVEDFLINSRLGNANAIISARDRRKLKTNISLSFWPLRQNAMMLLSESWKSAHSKPSELWSNS